jgi:hypothetical protein
VIRRGGFIHNSLFHDSRIRYEGRVMNGWSRRKTPWSGVALARRYVLCAGWIIGVGVVTLLLLAAAVDVAIRCGALPAVKGGVDGVIESVVGCGGWSGRCRTVELVMIMKC